MRSGGVRNAMNSRALSAHCATRSRCVNPNIRARVAAGAAMAGWYYGRLKRMVATQQWRIWMGRTAVLAVRLF